MSRIHEEGLEKYFISFEGFVEHRRFYEHLSMSKLILPLITPGSLDYDDYLKYKITGTYNLAWGFQRPMLMHESFKEYRIFRETSFFFRSGEMIQTIKTLVGQEEKLARLGKGISELKDFDFNVQADRYVRFLRRGSHSS